MCVEQQLFAKQNKKFLASFFLCTDVLQVHGHFGGVHCCMHDAGNEAGAGGASPYQNSLKYTFPETLKRDLI